VFSLIIPSFSDDLLDACLSSLQATDQTPEPYVIVVADNGLSEDFKDKWPALLYYPVPHKPFVYSKAINVCAQALPNNDLFILGDDTDMLTPRWPWRIREFFKHWPSEYGMVNVSETTRTKPPLQMHEVEESPVSLAFVGTLIPRFVWNKIGPMDERYVGYGFDDIDYCVRLWRAGLKIGVCGAATIKHEKGTVGYQRALGSWDEVIQKCETNYVSFYAKWGLPLPPKPWEIKPMKAWEWMR